MVIRLCLSYGVHPVFIPIGEPWRNGVVERFNDTYDKRFFRRQWFSSYAVLKQQNKNFQRFHNKHHRYSCLKGKTAHEMKLAHGFAPITVRSNSKMPDLSFIPDGNVSLVRFIRSNRQLDIFGERFEVSRDLIYSYVRAQIVTNLHAVQLYLGNDIVDTFEYLMPDDLLPVEQTIRLG